MARGDVKLLFSVQLKVMNLADWLKQMLREVDEYTPSVYKGLMPGFATE